jgi:hypothetical protein
MIKNVDDLIKEVRSAEDKKRSEIEKSKNK